MSTSPAPTQERHRPDLFGRPRTLAVLATSVVMAASGVALAAAPAHAEVTRHDGVVQFTSVLNCDGVVWGYPYYESGVGSVASVLYDDAVPPRAGDVFYVSVETTAVGNPYPCLDQSMRPDLTLPTGVSLAVSAANPIRCTKWDYTVDPYVGTPETTLCPEAPQGAESGGTVGLGTASGGTWKIPTGIGYEVQVPVVAADQGIKSFTFPVRVVDGNSNPILKVSQVVEILPAPAVVTPTPTTAPTTTSTATSTAGTSTTTPTTILEPDVRTSVSTDVDKVVRLTRTRGAVPVDVTVTRAGSRVRLKLVVRWRGRSVAVASRKLTADAAGVTRTRVTLNRTWRARLKGTRVKAVLTSRATAPDGSTARAAKTLKLKG